MPRKRPKGVLAMGWACFECAATGRTEHAPTSADYPETVLRRTSVIAGGGHGWKISALETPRETPAPWRIVVITGAPSWAEYWAETLAELPRVHLLPRPEEKPVYQRKRRQDWTPEDERWFGLSLLRKIARIDAVAGEVLRRGEGVKIRDEGREGVKPGGNEGDVASNG